MATQVDGMRRVMLSGAPQPAPPLLTGQRDLLKPTIGGVTLGAISSSTGSPLLDVAVGAGVGWLIAPSDKKVGYALGGGAATGLAGALGLLGLLGFRYFADRR